VRLTIASFLGVFLDVVGPWLVRYVAAACAYVVLAGWALLAGAMMLTIGVSLAAMWGPERWFEGAEEEEAR
jgi:hypothetical protein